MVVGTMLVVGGLAIPMIMVPVILVNLVDQPEVLQMHVGRCWKPRDNQQQRHQCPHPLHPRNLGGNNARIKAKDGKVHRAPRS